MRQYMIWYNTVITKDKLYVIINGSTFEQAFDSFCQLIPEAQTVTFVQKMF